MKIDFVGVIALNKFTFESLSNRVKLRSILFATAVFIFISIYTMGIGLILSIVVWIFVASLLKNEASSLETSAAEFNKSYPLRRFGVSFGEFLHVFHYQKTLEPDICRRINQELLLKTPIKQLMSATITDKDPALQHPDERLFRFAITEPTSRGTRISLVLSFSQFGAMQTIQWWVLAGGYIERNKYFNFVAYSPFTVWFWIFKYFNCEYDVLSSVRTVYPSSYNMFDIQTRTKSLHEAVFTALITELDDHGIDTSVLRAQRVQMMSINIAGGNTTIGNIIQGAKNSVVHPAQRSST